MAGSIAGTCPARRCSSVRSLFPELLQILARAAGKSSYGSPSDFDGASVDIFSDELLNEGPAKLNPEIAPLPGADWRGPTAR